MGNLLRWEIPVCKLHQNTTWCCKATTEIKSVLLTSVQGMHTLHSGGETEEVRFIFFSFSQNCGRFHCIYTVAVNSKLNHLPIPWGLDCHYPNHSVILNKWTKIRWFFLNGIFWQGKRQRLPQIKDGSIFSTTRFAYILQDCIFFSSSNKGFSDHL